jgi:transcriptional regulator with XRE-family HTH domain
MPRFVGVSTRLQSFLASNRITQASVARASEMDPAALNRSLRGARRFTTDEAVRILDYLSSVVGRQVTFEEVFVSEDAAAGQPEPSNEAAQ